LDLFSRRSYLLRTNLRRKIKWFISQKRVENTSEGPAQKPRKLVADRLRKSPLGDPGNRGLKESEKLSEFQGLKRAQLEADHLRKEALGDPGKRPPEKEGDPPVHIPKKHREQKQFRGLDSRENRGINREQLLLKMPQKCTEF